MKRHRTVASVHNDWLSVVEPVGAFLTLPVLKRVLANGIPPLDRDRRADVRQRLEALGQEVGERTAWLQFVLRDLLGLDARLREGAGMPSGLQHLVAEHSVILRPNYAVVDHQPETPDRPRMLVIRWPHRTPLDRRPATDENGRASRWAATPIERAALLCRATGVPLALVTDTDHFALVWAPKNAPGGHAIWPSSLFAEERLLLDSFVALLEARRFFGVPENEMLEAMLRESSSAQHEVTDRLGRQVRHAVEALVGAFSRAHLTSGRTLLADVPPREVYNAAVSVLMRLVVLLSAEERRLLPADDELYAAHYAVSSLREQLEADASHDTLDTLEKRHTAWHRLLATFRAVSGGITHDRLRLAAYGGTLFDPDRYPFLEGRSAGQPWTHSSGTPLPVDDRTVLAILDAIQVLSFRIGGITEARRLSYRNLDVEQIGHVYEGLLDHGCAIAVGVSLGVLGKKGDEPEISLSDLERELAKGEKALGEWLEEHGGPDGTRVQRLLYEALDADEEHRLRAVCDNDETVFKRVLPFAGLIRRDLRDLPMVFMPGSLFVTQTSLRRDSGTAYTTKELADEVVQYALEPLVYSPGPAERTDATDWQLKSADEILRLKVCDPAVGSGAILVAACRYLADRIVEAWQVETDTGHVPDAVADVPPSEWTLHARRLVTDHCLYGVDRNPMALDMARLSMWLTTMARERPFTFLDHQLRCGDSLLGITDLNQIRWFHIDPEKGRELHGRQPLFDPTKSIEPAVNAALAKAQELSAIDVITLNDVERKAALQEQMVEAMASLSVLADAVVGAALATPPKGYRPPWLPEDDETPTTEDLLDQVVEHGRVALDQEELVESRRAALDLVREKSGYWLDTDRPDQGLERRCLHWPLVFPEVFLSGPGGFDAIVGNPPFRGGKLLSSSFGAAYRAFLVERIAGGVRGNADLVAYFSVRAYGLLAQSGLMGILATHTVSRGDTREVGLDQLVVEGAQIVRAVPRQTWPGTSTLEIAKLWITRRTWIGARSLDDKLVPSISSYLTAPRRTSGKPTPLTVNKDLAHVGSYLRFSGFIVTTDQAEALLREDMENRHVLFPYLNGDDLASHWDHSASRWVIDFHDWPLARDADGQWRQASEAQKKAWLRSGHVPIDYEGRTAAEFPKCLNIIDKTVKAERALRIGSEIGWWKHWRNRTKLYKAAARLSHVIVVAQTTKYHSFIRVPTGMVYDQKLIVFTTSAWEPLGVLQSSMHTEWVLEYGSSLGVTPAYTPSDCLETFPFPTLTESIGLAGKRLHEHRSHLMRDRGEGLTQTYNRMHDENDTHPDVDTLRRLHRELDQIVSDAYAWNDVDLVHGFYRVRDEVRFTIAPQARLEILDRLVELNHQRSADEVAQGLRGKKTPANKGSGQQRRRSKPKHGAPLLDV